jgi:hypothetical protein
LGDVLTISTTHLSSSVAVNGNQQSATPASIFTSIFPERDAKCKIEECVQINQSIPTPYNSVQLPLGLTPLHALTGKAGEDVSDAKILVCVMDLGEYQNCAPAIL